MSHEIRSPLNAVIGFTTLLQETELSPEQAEHAGIVRGAGDHLRGVIDDILDLPKIESGRLELESIPLDLVACVEDAVTMVAPRAEDDPVNRRVTELLLGRLGHDDVVPDGVDPHMPVWTACRRPGRPRARGHASSRRRPAPPTRTGGPACTPALTTSSPGPSTRANSPGCWPTRTLATPLAADADRDRVSDLAPAHPD